MEFNPNEVFLGENAPVSYGKLGRNMTFTNNALLGGVNHSKLSFSTFLGRLDIAIFSHLRNHYPDKNFVTAQVIYSPIIGQNPIKNDIFFKDIIVEETEIRNRKKIYKCNYGPFTFTFMDFVESDHSPQAINTNTVSGIDGKEIIIIDGNSLNIHGKLGGPEIIRLFEQYFSPDKAFIIKLMKSGELGESLFLEEKNEKTVNLRKIDQTLIASLTLI